ncbi:ribonuclease III [Cuneatibacter caecimuris]|uniref:Ribonuclease 3 n=1 Tax=Cuneatibacter caecimuris TaxID=1796618 RepID=A0A4Q7PRT1_9FIRM|nr:ribonuclease III [Cuneatibacter caecimuris]RZT01980.1 ribonuclease-3 [Cuneatibacter caecimuris]
MRSMEQLQETVQYHFRDSGLLRLALTHSSYNNEHHQERLQNNERLEFLGDAVLELVSSDFLFHRYPDKPEGEMTKLRASLVCEPSLAYCARDISLGEYLYLGKGEDATGGRNRDSITSDAMEALIGAIYLDGGFASAKEFILKYILNDLENKQLFYDSKTILQEMVQKEDSQECLVYEILDEVGPDHDKQFLACVTVEGRELGRGKGRTKKAAQQMAAYQAILHLRAGRK